MPTAEAFDVKHKDLFINGEFRPSASGKRTQLINPATEEQWVDVAEGGAEDVDASVAAAKKALTSKAWIKPA